MLVDDRGRGFGGISSVERGGGGLEGEGVKMNLCG